MTVGFQNSAGVDLDNIFAVTNSNDGALGFVTNDNQDIGNRYPLGSVGFEVGYKDSTGTDIGFLRAKSFAITYSNDGNGTVTSNPKDRGVPNNPVAVTATPNSSYLVDKITWNNIPIENNGTFMMPNGSVNINATFVFDKNRYSCSSLTTWYINDKGELYGCGFGLRGQQGTGNTNNILTFTKHGSGIKKVVCSVNTTWALASNGDLYGCGYGYYGQQGNNSTTNVLTFTKRASNVRDVVCSDYTTWYINNDNELFGCGCGLQGQQGNGGNTNVTTFTKRAENVRSVACCCTTTWYITNNNELFGCGTNYCGSQGNGQSGSTASDVTTFTKRADNVKEVQCSEKRYRHLEISATGTDPMTKETLQTVTWYVNTNNELFGCGLNSYGNQGNGTYGFSQNADGTWQLTNTFVSTFTKRADNVIYFYCDDEQTWYVNKNHELFGCGCNDSYQQSSGSSTQTHATHITNFTKRADNVASIIGCDGCFIMGSNWYITTDYKLFGVGYGACGQQGDGVVSGTHDDDNTPIDEVHCAKTFTQRATNVAYCFPSEISTWYVTRDGQLWGAGSSGYGQQGSGNTDKVSVFTRRV